MFNAIKKERKEDEKEMILCLFFIGREMRMIRKIKNTLFKVLKLI